ncbi:heterokaryon incompatibility protein-domain-containing protein, partial [Phaeosphaeriaceae sp. PMI808]
MENATPLWFKHNPLPDSTTHMRLLEIAEGNFDQHVACKLSVWPMNAVPSYLAISYTWGPTDPPAIITINEKQLEVRQNCEYVLQQAFSSKASQYFWVDALCIDQTSNEEKNDQVAMMGQIYNQAEHVFACVG